MRFKLRKKNKTVVYETHFYFRLVAYSFIPLIWDSNV